MVAIEHNGTTVRVTVRDHGPGIPEDYTAAHLREVRPGRRHRRAAEGRHRARPQHRQADHAAARRRRRPRAGAGRRHASSTSNCRAGTRSSCWRPSGSAAPANALILLCEDDPDAAAVLADRLRAAGFPTDVAYTAEEAVKGAATRSYAAILVDLQLPDSDGISLIKQSARRSRATTTRRSSWSRPIPSAAATTSVPRRSTCSTGSTSRSTPSGCCACSTGRSSATPTCARASCTSTTTATCCASWRRRSARPPRWCRWNRSTRRAMCSTRSRFDLAVLDVGARRRLRPRSAAGSVRQRRPADSGRGVLGAGYARGGGAGAGGADEVARLDRQSGDDAAAAGGGTGACAGTEQQGGRMTALRVLHVDDEPDIREVVELSLGLDPDFTVRGCASGARRARGRRRLAARPDPARRHDAGDGRPDHAHASAAAARRPRTSRWCS